MAKPQEPKLVRLRNTTSGAVVQTTEENAARLGAEWTSADAKKSTSSAKK